MADFCLIGQRVLDEFEGQIFRIHYQLGADWKLCCERLHLDRGEFFHHIYSIERRLGRALAEMEPYALYPPSEYFTGGFRHEAGMASYPDPRFRRSSDLPLSA